MFRIRVMPARVSGLDATRRATTRSASSLPSTRPISESTSPGGVVWAEQSVPSGLAALLVTTMPFWMALFDWRRATFT